MLIGRSGSCQVQVLQDSISSIHALVVLVDQEVWAVDLGSTNGLFIGCKRVEHGTLSNEESFFAGTQKFRVCIRESRRALPEPSDSSSERIRSLQSELLRSEQERAVLQNDVVYLAGRVDALSQECWETANRAEAERRELASGVEAERQEFLQERLKLETEAARLDEISQLLDDERLKIVMSYEKLQQQESELAKVHEERCKELGRSQEQLESERKMLAEQVDEFRAKTNQLDEEKKDFQAIVQEVKLKSVELARKQQELNRDRELLMVQRIRQQKELKLRAQEIVKKQQEIARRHEQPSPKPKTETLNGRSVESLVTTSREVGASVAPETNIKELSSNLTTTPVSEESSLLAAADFVAILDQAIEQKTGPGEPGPDQNGKNQKRPDADEGSEPIRKSKASTEQNA